MEKNWDFYYNEGVSYYDTAIKSYSGKGKQFNNELLFNIVSMSMESVLVSLLLFHKKMPLSETVSGLIRELKEVVEWPEEFIKEVRWLNRFINLCSLDPTPMKVPNDEEMKTVLSIATQVQERVSAEFPPDAKLKKMVVLD